MGNTAKMLVGGVLALNLLQGNVNGRIAAADNKVSVPDRVERSIQREMRKETIILMKEYKKKGFKRIKEDAAEKLLRECLRRGGSSNTVRFNANKVILFKCYEERKKCECKNGNSI